MTKSFADTCLERSEKATPGPWEVYSIIDRFDEDGIRNYSGVEIVEATIPYEQSGINLVEDAQFIAHAREDVPELARRLKRACQFLRAASEQFGTLKGGTTFYCEWNLSELADELEAMPEEK